jgi:hypothetical protein
MRNQKDRRAATAADPFARDDNQFGQPFQEKRHPQDRRMENMSLEERQLQFSEMPSLDLHKQK